MHQLRILLRADAAGDIGIGHVKRCLSLGQALVDCGAEVLLLTRLSDFDTRALACQVGIDCVGLAAGENPGWLHDAQATSKEVSRLDIDWVIVDHYQFDARWHKQVASAGARIAVIDDLADRPLAASVVVDQNIADHAAKYAEVLPMSTPILGGPRFALLSRAYANAPKWTDRGAVRSIGIFMGGTDAAGMTEVVLRACREVANFDGAIEIATTGGNARLPSLRAQCDTDPRTSLLVDAEELTGFFAKHDVQIGAGGGASWERCCLGVPTLLLRCAPNQDAVIPALMYRGVVRTLEPGQDRDIVAVGAAVRELIDNAGLRSTLSQRSRDTIDGLGARRVALFLSAESLHVRPASDTDAMLLHQWRNHESTRSMSVYPREISLEEHLGWYTRSLRDSSRCILIGMVGNIPVGSIRFDRLAGGEHEISLYLDPALHGLRLGTHLLRQGEIYMKDGHDTVPTFVATVLNSNPGSRKLFAAAGYRNIGDRWYKNAA